MFVCLVCPSESSDSQTQQFSSQAKQSKIIVSETDNTTLAGLTDQLDSSDLTLYGSARLADGGLLLDGSGFWKLRRLVLKG